MSKFSSDQALVYGQHAVLAILKNTPQLVRKCFYLESRRDKKLNEILECAEASGISVIAKKRQFLDDMVSQQNHQGIIAAVEKISEKFQPTDLLEFLQQTPKPWLLLILDGVEDPHNLGACLRTADAVGVTAIIIPKDRAVGVNATVKKVACGAAEFVPVFVVTNLARTLRELAEDNVWLYGADCQGETSLYDLEWSSQNSIGLVLGSEGRGLRRLTKEHCDYLFQIPLIGHVQSLNVSVATAICLFEIRRQRLKISREEST